MNSEKLYRDSEEKYLAATIMYGKSEDGYLYYDSACTEKVPQDDMMRVFSVGMLVNVDIVMYRPVSCGLKNGGAYVAIIENDTSLTEVEFASKEATVK